MRPVGVGDSTISRSAAVTSSSSGSSRALLRRHQVEFDDAPAGRAIVDRVIGDAVARIERHRRVGLAHRHAQLERAGGEIVAADRRGEGRVHERQHAHRPASGRAGRRCRSPARPRRGACRRPAWRCAAAAARSQDARCRRAAARRAARAASGSCAGSRGVPRASAHPWRCASRRRPACRRGAAPRRSDRCRRSAASCPAARAVRTAISNVPSARRAISWLVKP